MPTKPHDIRITRQNEIAELLFTAPQPFLGDQVHAQWLQHIAEHIHEYRKIDPRLDSRTVRHVISQLRSMVKPFVGKPWLEAAIIMLPLLNPQAPPNYDDLANDDVEPGATIAPSRQSTPSSPPSGIRRPRQGPLRLRSDSMSDAHEEQTRRHLNDDQPNKREFNQPFRAQSENSSKHSKVAKSAHPQLQMRPLRIRSKTMTFWMQLSSLPALKPWRTRHPT